MRILCTGDWHITAAPPQKRTDEYLLTQENKIKFILETAQTQGCSCILQPGDFYDHHKEPLWLIRKYMKLFALKKTVPIYTLFGQHDQRYHTVAIENTPLGVTEVSEHVFLLGQKPLKKEGVHIYGSDWSQEIPTIETADAVNILVLHKMIIKDKLWEQQEEFVSGTHLLRKTQFDLVVSGDNHSLFFQTVGKKHLINCGSLMRSTTGQKEHVPTIFIVDIKGHALEIEPIQIPVCPFSSVFNTEKIQTTKKQNKEMLEFVTNLSTKSVFADLDYYKNLMGYIDTENISPEITSIIHSVIPH